MGAGKDEEKLRRCFVGKAGKYMRQIIKHIWEQGAAFNLAISNNVRFHPMDTNGKDREPTEEEISRCIVHLRRDINLLRPKTIIPVGKNATSTFKTVGNASMTSLRGIPFVVTLDEEYTFIPTWHPSFLCRSYGSFNPEGNNIYDKQFIQDILLALGED